MYGRPFRLTFFMEITVHFRSTEGYLFQDSCWKGNCNILLEYGRPFRLRFLVEIPLHFWSMEGHLGYDSWWRLLYTSGIWKDIWVKMLIGKEITIYFWSVEGHLGQDYWWKSLCKGICSIFLAAIAIHFLVWKVIWVKTSCWKLLYTSGVLKDISIKVLPRNYYTLLKYGRRFGSRFLVEITIHFWSME